MRSMTRFAVLGLLCIAALGARAQERVTVQSLDRVNGVPVELPAYWFPVSPTSPQARAPAAVLLHGCGGALARSGELGARMTEYAALLNAHGVNVLVTDSLTPRGERELCTQRTGTRRVTQANRRLDALAAVAWRAVGGLGPWAPPLSAVTSTAARSHWSPMGAVSFRVTTDPAVAVGPFWR